MRRLRSIISSSRGWLTSYSHLILRLIRVKIREHSRLRHRSRCRSNRLNCWWHEGR